MAGNMDNMTEMQRNRLPVLAEVLSRRTLAPVDLFSFYIYMRDQQRSVDYLDFWLDVSQHLSLCRHFVRELRQSVLLETPELEKAARSRDRTQGDTGSKRSSQVLEQFDLVTAGPGPAGSVHSEHDENQRVSALVRDTRADRGRDARGQSDSASGKHSQKGSSSSQKSREATPTYGKTEGYSRTQDDGNTPSDQRPPRPSFMTSNFGDSPGRDSTPQHTVVRDDIRASAEKILYQFLLPGSEREIMLPQSILNDIVEAIEEHRRDDPEIFDAAKDYVFQAMERDAFPGFLKTKALGNVVPLSMMLRLVVGLLAMFGAFWAAFILIFLDKSRATRCWLILPFTVGIYALASHQYMLDPILAAIGYSEYTFFSFTRVREPFVRSLLVKRALYCGMWIVLITTALVCLFVFVPGKRL